MHALLWNDELFAVVAFMRQGRENNMLQVRGGIWTRTATKDYFRYCLITILPESNVMSSNIIFLSDKLSKSRGNQQIFTFEKLKPENETSSQNCWQYIFCPEFANSSLEARRGINIFFQHRSLCVSLKITRALLSTCHIHPLWVSSPKLQTYFLRSCVN